MNKKETFFVWSFLGAPCAIVTRNAADSRGHLNDQIRSQDPFQDAEWRTKASAYIAGRVSQ